MPFSNAGLAAALAATASTPAESVDAEFLAYPLAIKATRLRCAGCGIDAANPADFDILVCCPRPTLQALSAQKRAIAHVVVMLHTVTGVHTTAADTAGALAMQAHSKELFDYNSAEAITNGDVDVDVRPLDLALGVLPLAQLVLNLWVAHHAFRPGGASKLLECAQKLDFMGVGSFAPARARPPAGSPHRMGLRPQRR